MQKFVCTFAGKHADYLRDNIAEIKSEYDLPLALKRDCVQITVQPGKFLKSGALKVDSKYKIFLKTEVEAGAGKTNFSLTRFEVPGSKAPGPSAEPDLVSPKKFLL